MDIKEKIMLFLKGSMILTLSNICTKAINFFLLPLYTKYLTPEQLGVSDTVTTLVGLVLPILVLGLDSAFSAFYFDEDSEEHRNKVFSNITIILALMSFIPLILIIFSTNISNIVFGKGEYWYIVVISLLSLSCQLWYLPYSLYLRVENRMTAFGIITTISSLVMIISNIITVYMLEMGEAALIVSTLVTNIVMCGLYLLVVRKKPNKKYIDIDLNKKIFRYSLPIVPLAISTWILTASDRVIILAILGESEVGIYGIAARFVTVVNVFTNSVYTAYTTFVFSVKEYENSKYVYSRILNIFYITLTIVVLFISMFGKEILTVMVDGKYLDAYKIMAPLLFAQVLYAAITIVGYGIAFKKRSEFMLFSVTIAAVVNIALNLLLIEQLGLQVAAMSTWIGYLIMLILVNYFSQKLYPCPYEIMKLVVSSIVLLAISLLTVEYAILAVRIIIYIMALMMLFMMYQADIKLIIGQLKKYNQR